MDNEGVSRLSEPSFHRPGETKENNKFLHENKCGQNKSTNLNNSSLDFFASS